MYFCESDDTELPEQVDLPESTKRELDKRLAAFHRNPSLGSPWKKVKKRILAGR
jgi:putative addiction module component (TIGR02574 family)